PRIQADEDRAIAALLVQLRDGIRKVDQQTEVVDDPTGDITHSKLALLKWNEAFIAQAIALFADSTVFAAPLTPYPPGLKIPAALQARVSYNVNSGTLEVRGVPSTNDVAVLKGATADLNVDLTVYKGAVDAIANKARAEAKAFISKRMRAFVTPPVSAP